jgi:Mn-dependent DtxR family transcriptional regulator
MTPSRATRITRDLSPSSEHYLRAVLELREERGYARVVDIATRLGLTKGSVSLALGHLEERGLVRFDAARFPVLTAAGKRVALDVRGRFQIVLAFLTDVLGLSAEQAAAEACRWEHVVSHDVADRILDFIRFTSTTPEQHDLLESFTNYRRSCAAGQECTTCAAHGPVQIYCLDPGSKERPGRSDTDAEK